MHGVLTVGSSRVGIQHHKHTHGRSENDEKVPSGFADGHPADSALAGPIQAAEKFLVLQRLASANEPAAPGAPAGFLLVNGSGGGIATHLGRFTISWSFTVNLTELTGSGPLVFTAANGDQIFAHAVGASEPTNTPGIFRVREVFTISGGTGRFLNAQGNVITDRLTDLNTGFTSGSFQGTISSPGSAK